MSEGTIVEWRKQPGDWVEYEEPIVDISTDKIDTEVPAPAAGRVDRVVVAVGTTVDVGTVLARIATDASPARARQRARAAGAGPRARRRRPRERAAAAAGRHAAGARTRPRHRAATAQRRRYTPVVSRMAAEHGLDLSQMPGTGRSGRVRSRTSSRTSRTAGRRGREAPSRRCTSSRLTGPTAGREAGGPVPTGDGEPLSRMRKSFGET